MKKALSLLLAILMIFSIGSVAAFADDGSGATDIYHEAGFATGQAALEFSIGAGTYMYSQYVFDVETAKLVNMTPNEIKAYTEDTGLNYVMLPMKNDTTSQKPNAYVDLPEVIAPEGRVFKGWRCQDDNKLYVPGDGEGYQIPEDGADRVISFRAVYGTGEMQEETFPKVIKVLSKIFGTILGLLMGKSSAWGIAFVSKLFDGIA